MTFKQMILEKLKDNVACRVANDNNLIRAVAGAVIDDLDYSELASMLSINDSDIADEIDTIEVLSDIVEYLDVDELREAVINKCDIDEVADKVFSMLPCNYMDDLAIQVAEKLIEEIGNDNNAA